VSSPRFVQSTLPRAETLGFFFFPTSSSIFGLCCSSFLWPLITQALPSLLPAPPAKIRVPDFLTRRPSASLYTISFFFSRRALRRTLGALVPVDFWKRPHRELNKSNCLFLPSRGIEAFFPARNRGLRFKPIFALRGIECEPLVCCQGAAISSSLPPPFLPRFAPDWVITFEVAPANPLFAQKRFSQFSSISCRHCLPAEQTPESLPAVRLVL